MSQPRVFAIKDENENYVDKSSFTFIKENLYLPYTTINRVDLQNSLDEAKEIIRKLNSHIKLHIVEINPITLKVYNTYKNIA